MKCFKPAENISKVANSSKQSRERRTYCVDAEQFAAREEQMVHSRQLPVKPDVDIDDWHAYELLHLSEVVKLGPLVWHQLLDHIDCIAAIEVSPGL